MAEPLLAATPHGDARLHVRLADDERLRLVLHPGANGSVQAQDLVALASGLPLHGVTTVLVQPPFAVAGRRVAPRPPVLDEDLVAVVEQLRGDTPLVLGGRSAGARAACRCARTTGARAVLALAFPLHPPGAPEKSRAAELLGSGVPTLVLHGTRDTFGGPEEFPDLPATTTLVPVPGADHGFRVAAASGVTRAETLASLVATAVAWPPLRSAGNP